MTDSAEQTGAFCVVTDTYPSRTLLGHRTGLAHRALATDTDFATLGRWASALFAQRGVHAAWEGNVVSRLAREAGVKG